MSENTTGVEIPLEKLTRIYIKMREKKAEVAHEMEDKIDKIDSDMKTVKSAILQHMKDIGAESLKTSAGVVYRPELIPAGLNANSEYSVTIRRS